MIKPLCVVNGRLTDIPAAPVTDRALMLGDGLIETVKVAGAQPVWLDEHRERLAASCRFAGIGLSPEWDIDTLCRELLDRTGLNDGFVRIEVSGGTSPGGRFADRPEEGNLYILCGEAAEAAPVKAARAPWELNEDDPAVYHKTASRFSLVTARRMAAERGLGEFVFFNKRSHLCEGITGNIFFVKHGMLRTPAKECGLLPGITRAKVLELSAANGIPAEEWRYTINDLRGAEEIFFTNSLALVIPCTEFDGNPVPGGDIAGRVKDILCSSFQ